MTQIDTIVTALKLRPGISNISDGLITDIVQDVIINVKEYLNLDIADETIELPLGCVSIVKELVATKCNRLGSEGLSSTSNSGVSENYINGIPDDVKAKIRRYRKLP